MAMIQCPECNKEVSDQAEACPHCGYSFTIKTKKTELSENKKYPALGFLFIIVGIGAIIGGFVFISLIISVFIGIFAIIGGIAFISAGYNYISGMQEGKCPYCGAKMRVKYKNTACKCSECSKTCKKSKYYLEQM